MPEMNFVHIFFAIKMCVQTRAVTNKMV